MLKQQPLEHNSPPSKELGNSFESLLRKVVDTTSVSGAFIGLLDPQKSSFEVVFSSLPTEQEVPPLTVSGFPFADVIRTRSSVTMPDTASPLPHYKLSSTTQSICCFPLLGVDGVVGILQAEREKAGHFDSSEERILELAACTAEAHVRNYEIWRQLSRKSHELAAFQEITKCVAHEPDTAIVNILRSLSDVFDFWFLTISLVDEVTNTISTRHGIWQGTIDKFPDWVSQARYSLDDKDIQVDVVRTGKTEIISEWDPRLNKKIWDEYKHVELIRVFVPIKYRGKGIGTIEAGHRKDAKARIDEEELRALEASASQIAIALNNVEAIETAKRRNQACGTQSLLESIAGLFAHRVRNIAGPIPALARFIREKLQETEPAPDRDIIRGLDTIRECLSELGEMVKMFQLGTRFKTQQTSHIELNKLMQELLESAHLPTNIQVVTLLDDDLPGLMLDPTVLREALLNIIDNASEAMAMDGGTLRVSTRLLNSGSRILVTIQDTGPGIPENIRHKLLQHPGITTKDGGNHGVGLFYAALFFRSVGGDIQINEGEGPGAKLRVLLPVAVVE